MKTQENEQKTMAEMDVMGLKLAVGHQSVEMEELKDSKEGEGLGLHSCIYSFSCSLFSQ